MDSGRRSVILGGIFLAIAILLIAISYMSQRQAGRSRSASTDTPDTPTAGTDASSNSSVARPGQGTHGQSEVKQAGAGAQPGDGRGRAADKGDDPFDYGRTTPVKGDANPQVASVVEAVKTKSHGERLSVMLSPKAFNLEEYRRKPREYIDVVEPGRAHMPHQPGPDVPRIQAASPLRIKMKQGQSVVLRAQVPPEMPCTYTSFDLGRFENELTSVTVAANADGIAETRFFAPPGTIEDVHILCASPVLSGQLRFVVTVSK